MNSFECLLKKVCYNSKIAWCNFRRSLCITLRNSKIAWCNFRRSLCIALRNSKIAWCNFRRSLCIALRMDFRAIKRWWRNLCSDSPKKTNKKIDHHFFLTAFPMVVFGISSLYLSNVINKIGWDLDFVIHKIETLQLTLISSLVVSAWYCTKGPKLMGVVYLGISVIWMVFLVYDYRYLGMWLIDCLPPSASCEEAGKCPAP